MPRKPKSPKRVSKSPTGSPSVRKRADKLSFIPDAGIDFSRSRVETIFYGSDSIELLVSHAIQPVTKSDIKIRFEAIREYAIVNFELGDILAETFKRKQFAPKAGFNHLTAKRAARAKFQWKVEIALAPARKPYSFQCKRILVTTTRGKYVAGDSALPRHKWKPKDYKQLSKHVAELILSESYDELVGLMDAKLRRRKSPEKVAAEFAQWKKLPKWASACGEARKRTAKAVYGIRISYTDDDDLPIPEGLGSLDPDSVRAQLTIEFYALFLLELTLVSFDDKLLIGRYEAHREW